jgi:SpoVK/Ycf46/Vps4 family AAA+-type ATPase
MSARNSRINSIDHLLPYCYAVSLVEESEMGTISSGSGINNEERFLSKCLWNKTVYINCYIRVAYNDSMNGIGERAVEEASRVEIDIFPDRHMSGDMSQSYQQQQVIRVFRVVSIQLKSLLHCILRINEKGRVSKRTLFRVLHPKDVRAEEQMVTTMNISDNSSSNASNETLIPLHALTELKDQCQSLNAFNIKMIEAHMDSGILSVLRQMYINRWSHQFTSHEISPLSLLSYQINHDSAFSNDKTYTEIILENFEACLTEIKSSLNTNAFNKGVHVLILKDMNVLFPSLTSSALSSISTEMADKLISFLNHLQFQCEKMNQQLRSKAFHIKIIGLTNNVQRVHEAIYNHFVMKESKNMVLVEKLDVAERKMLTSQLGYPSALFEDISRETTDKHAMEIVSLVSAQARMKELEIQVETETETKTKTKNNLQRNTQHKKEPQNEFVIFQENFIDMLQKDIIYTFKYPKVYNHFLASSQSLSELNMSIHGLLLYGPPGTGKTLYASHLSNLLKYSFVEVKITDVVKGELGSGEQMLINKLQEAKRCAPCILFIDEFQAMFTQRGTDQSSSSSSSSSHSSIDRDNVGSSLSSTLAGVFDEINVWNKFNNAANIAPILLVATTNEPWAIDNAFLRAGRFDRIVFVPPMASSSRQDFVLKKMNILFSHDGDENENGTGSSSESIQSKQLVEDITKHTQDFSGADMQLLFSMVQRDGFIGVDKCLFLKKMLQLLQDEKIQSSSKPSEIAKYLSWNPK